MQNKCVLARKMKLDQLILKADISYLFTKTTIFLFVLTLWRINIIISSVHIHAAENNSEQQGNV